MSKPAVLCISVALVLSAGLAGSAANPPSKEARLSDEPGLRTRFSIEESRIFLGDLLDRMSHTTGVALEADDRSSPISGCELAVAVKERAAADVLEALARLYRTSGDRWRWEKEERAEKPLYVLHNTLGFAAQSASRQRFIEDFMLSQRDRLTRFYSLSPEQRARVASSDSRFRFLDTPRAAAYNSLVANLPADQIRYLMAGHRVEIPTSSLTSEQRGMIRDMYAETSMLGKPGVPQPESLTHITLLGHQHDTGLYLQVGPLGGPGILGGNPLTDVLHERTEAGWVAADESRKAADTPIPAPGSPMGAADVGPLSGAPDGLLMRLAEAGRLNLLFDRASDSRFNLQGAATGRLPAVMEGLRKEIISKSWKGFVLCRPEEWQAFPREEWTPWPVIRDLRRRAAENGGYLRPTDWYRLASLTPGQLRRLNSVIPDSARVRRAQAGLLIARDMSEAEMRGSETGSTWREWSLSTRRRVVAAVGPESRTAELVFQWVDAKPRHLRYYFGPETPAPRVADLPFYRRPPDR